ncbi:MAG: DUF1080 domain-containing protein [Saprospiraceae bacterium]|nr:MAG: cytochrome c class I [Bacteroidetes bacterium OLB9]MCO6463365.1 DUF1080 domain-containing protein [Saprospiraceae bacterium]
MRSVKLLFLIIIIGFLAQCSNDKSSSVNRPLDYWVFRSVLDWNPRMITMALSDELWASYYVETGSLYKAWKGTVYFDGPVYTTAHGPQPISIGNSYTENRYKKPWFVLNGQDTVAIQYNYRGHKFVDGKVRLMYSLIPENSGKPIKIEEEVEAGMKGDRPIFERAFYTTDVPEGYQVALRFNLNSVSSEADIKTDGQLNIVNTTDIVFENQPSKALDGFLVLKPNGKTTFNTTFLKTPVLENKNGVKTDDEEENDVNAHEGLKLIAKSDCKACHNKTRQTIGPAYVAIADKYPNTDENVQLLMSKIKNGGSGIWGQQVMTPHKDIADEDLRTIVDYVLSLRTSKQDMAKDSAASLITLDPDPNIVEDQLLPGSVVKIYDIPSSTKTMPVFSAPQKPKQAGILKQINNLSGGDFKELQEYFALVADGVLKIEKAGTYTFHLWSDDGSKLYINNKEVIDNDGLHGAEYKDVSIEMKEGYYSFHLDFFQGAGGSFLGLNWKKPGDEDFEAVPAFSIFHNKFKGDAVKGFKLPMANTSKVPGDKFPLEEVHPSFDLYQARPNNFKPMVGGLDFMSDGTMIVSTWEPAGAVYRVNNVGSGDTTKMTFERIAFGLAEPLGLKVVNDTIYVMQKQELTRLLDNDGDGQIDEYQTVSDDWRVSSNFHEFGFGLAYKDGYFYATLATAIVPGGASVNPQIPDRGKVIKINKNTGALNFVASGLRTPNGVGIGYGGYVYVADNQGDWLPSSKIVQVKDGAWYGSRSVDFEGTKDKIADPPLVWLPQDEIGNSPSTPLSLDLGPYKGQMIHGEVTHGGVKRVFVEEVNGQLQGCVFRFIQGLEAGVNRLQWGPNNDLYVGGIGNPGNWGQTGKLQYGLQRLVYNGKPTFEMLAVRAKSNGMEIEFTEPLSPGDGWKTDEYEVKQWYYKATEQYGGPKLGEENLKVKSATVSADRRKVFLEIDGLKSNHVVYIHLNKHFMSEDNHSIWSTEAWYTMNQVPTSDKGKVDKPPFVLANNTLTPLEKENGWELLFDGKTLNGWRNYKKQTIGKSWIVDKGAIHLNAQPNKDGGWQAPDGGDIITDQEFENYDFKCEWKIGNCGNSGIIFNVVESDKYNYVWETGPEMQVLDNTCHPDSRYKTHRAGDLYDLIECKYEVVKPAGEWNEARIRIVNGKADFWLNGIHVVSFTMFDDQWREMIAKSKFKDMPGFGLSKKGHIALQDHGDKVWFRNIKIRRL